LQLNLQDLHPSKGTADFYGIVIANYIRLRRYEILFIYIGEKSMKKIFIFLSGALFILSSCGISSRYSSSDSGQKFSDGIYSSAPSRKDKQQEQISKTELQALAEQTKASQVYLFGDHKDTVMIPENMAATIRYDKQLGTSVTVAEFDPYDFTYGWYTDRYRWNSYWNLGMWNSVYYRGWHDPWYYGSYYGPWHYTGWYDPWYYGGWYDPWYYGYGYRGWYDPFYGYMHPYYCGWYGGWDPYYYPHHHHHHVVLPSPGTHQGREVYRGSRLETSGSRVIASNRPSSNPVSGSVSRRVSTTSRSSFGTSRTSATREALGRRTTSSGRPSAASQPSGRTNVSGQSSTRSTATYRRPSGTAPRVSGNSGSSYSRSTSSSGSNSSYSRSSSSSNNSSSYTRSYSSPSRSSYSSGSSGSSGGYSRSSSGGGRR
jgi:hypothetical protein